MAAAVSAQVAIEVLPAWAVREEAARAVHVGAVWAVHVGALAERAVVAAVAEVVVAVADNGKNTTDGSRWILSDPTYLEITDTLLRAGEFNLSGGFNVRSPARKFLSSSFLLGWI